MIIKASQRGGGNKLASHLLNTNDNEHVELHDIRGFMSDDLSEAMQEAYAISRATKCKQFLFSVSLNPPQDMDVPIDTFEDAANRIEKAMKLDGQARAIVFHEKEGRRHAHAVWSRIAPETMKAINLPFFKNRMMEISRDLYLDYGWDMPKGMINAAMRNPLNFTHEEWQQAKRLKQAPRMVKATIQDTWQQSEDKQSFVELLDKRGFYLARGDRRGFVLVDWRGEVYSLTRMAGVKKKALQDKLGKEETLPSVNETKTNIDQNLVKRMQEITTVIHQRHDNMIAPMLLQRKRMKQTHRKAREALADKHKQQKQALATKHQARYKKGIMGLWERFTGKHGKIRRENLQEAEALDQVLKTERQALIQKQLKKRSHSQKVISNYQQHRDQELNALKYTMHSTIRTSTHEDVLTSSQITWDIL